jgi:hypothetical protein
MSAEISVALARARVAGVKLDAYPGPVPASIAAAYAIQAEAARLTGWSVVGWKIGCTSEKAQRALSTDAPFPGPVYRERLFSSGDLVPTAAGNTRLAEPEIAFRMATSLVPRIAPYEVDEVLAAVAEVVPAIEVVIPKEPEFDPFHRDDFARRLGATGAVGVRLQARRNDACGQKHPAFGGMKPAIGCVASLARCPASRYAPRLPEWPV